MRRRARFVLLSTALGLCGCESGSAGEDELASETDTGNDDSAALIGRCTEGEGKSFWDDDGLWAWMIEASTGCEWACPPNYAYQPAEAIADEAEWASWAPDLSAEASITILLIGDPGNWVASAGGEFPPALVAEAAHEACAGECDLGLLLGDAFYSHDVIDTASPQWANWRGAFERFCDPSCDDQNRFRFWAMLGNHDYFPPSEDGEGNPLPGNSIAAQIAYTDDPSNAGRLWMMPERAYAIPGLPDWLDLWVLDTVAVAESIKWSEEGAGGELADQQLVELSEGLLAAPPDSWKLVAGHHPALTVGSRDNAYQSHPEFRCQSFVEVDSMRGLVASLVPAGAHIMLAGHEHNQQLHPGDGYLQVVSGNASKFSSGDLEADEPGMLKHEGALGFALLELDPDQATLRFYSVAEGANTATLVDEAKAFTRDELAALTQTLGPLLE